MRRTILATTFAALLVFTGAPMLAHAEAKADKPAKAAKAHQPKADKDHKAGLTGEYGAMAKELQLTPEQQAKLLDLANQEKQSDKDWSEKNKDQWSKAMADRRSEDPAVKKQGGEAYAKLAKERRDAREAFQTQALAILTPEQRTQWEAYKLTKSAEMSLKRHKVTLTDEQQAQIKSLAADAVKGLNVNDQAALRKAQADLNTKVNETVLTEEQRQALPQPKAPKAKSKDKK